MLLALASAWRKRFWKNSYFHSRFWPWNRVPFIFISDPLYPYTPPPTPLANWILTHHWGTGWRQGRRIASQCFNPSITKLSEIWWFRRLRGRRRHWRWICINFSIGQKRNLTVHYGITIHFCRLRSGHCGRHVRGLHDQFLQLFSSNCKTDKLIITG